MVRQSGSTLDIIQRGSTPAKRREDVRALLNQQITHFSLAQLVWRAWVGEVEDWVNEYVMTPAVRDLIPEGDNTAYWPTLGTAVGLNADLGYVGWQYVKKMAPKLATRVARLVASFVAKIMARYGISFTVANGLAATGVGAFISVTLDIGLSAWLAYDLINAKEDLIDAILDVWFPE
jgi:hypothetical protein